jgi:hypothetical protein
MNDRSDHKKRGEKAWNTGRTETKTEKNNGDSKLNIRYIKKQNGPYLSEQILNYRVPHSGLASQDLCG